MVNPSFGNSFPCFCSAQSLSVNASRLDFMLLLDLLLTLHVYLRFCIVVISVTKEGVKFTTSGDIGSANVVCRQNNNVDNKVGLEVHLIPVSVLIYSSRLSLPKVYLALAALLCTRLCLAGKVSLV
jgi:hypothetical protein